MLLQMEAFYLFLQLSSIPLYICTPVSFFSRFYLFLERGEEKEKEGEKHQYVVASHAPPTGNLACNPGMCPDWK